MGKFEHVRYIQPLTKATRNHIIIHNDGCLHLKNPRSCYNLLNPIQLSLPNAKFSKAAQSWLAIHAYPTSPPYKMSHRTALHLPNPCTAQNPPRLVWKLLISQLPHQPTHINPLPSTLIQIPLHNALPRRKPRFIMRYERFYFICIPR